MQKSLVKYWYIGYLILLVSGIFYVRNILKQDDISIDKEKPNKTGVEEKIVKVDVMVNNGKSTKTYQTKLKNIDTVYDVFDKLHEDNAFYYEITGYLYGTEISCINATCAPEGYKWVALKDKEDITNVLKDTSLNDDSLITLELVKK